MKVIYCSHKYGGKHRNKKAAERKIKKLQKRYPELCFVSPIHAFCHSYKSIDYAEGMKLCLELLYRCDELWILSDDSKGVKIERESAKKYSIPIYEGVKI